MSIKITSPIEGYSETTYLGSIELKFHKGSVKVKELSDAARTYLLGAGYTVDGESIDQPEADEPVDSRDFDLPIQVGEPLRDGAVDPHEGDFLAPTNAGEADPHGPDVVSPEIHGSQGVRPVKAGDVDVDDADVQDEAETADAESATDGTPVDALEEPAGNASRETWLIYAHSTGSDVPEGLSRDDLRDQFGSKA